MIASTSGRNVAQLISGCAASSRFGSRVTFGRTARLVRREQGVKRSKLNAVLPSDDEKGGTGLLEKPDFDQSQEEKILPDSYYGSTDTPNDKGLGGGDWRVVLLDSPTHTEELVVKTLTTVIGSVDEQQAKNCYNTSKQLGQALVVSCMKEHAEFFAQMINRNGVRSVIEPDTTTL